jgi:hypothetical protein
MVPVNGFAGEYTIFIGKFHLKYMKIEEFNDDYR